MSDTLITVVAIFLAVILLVVVPLQVTSHRVDTMSKLDVDTLTSDFVDNIRTTGVLTENDYYNFKQKLTSTGNTYDIDMEFKILDENPGKKSTQIVRDKIGENVYYSVYTSQIEKNIEEHEKKQYALKEGDIVSVTVRNTNLTIGQQMKSFIARVTGNDTYTISASKSGLVTGNGATSTTLSTTTSRPTINVTAKNSDGKNIKFTRVESSGILKSSWTNKDVTINLSSEDKYNLDLNYYYKEVNANDNEYNSYDNFNQIQNKGNSLSVTTPDNTSLKRYYKIFWKSSMLEKYSDIKKIEIKIDKIKPTLNNPEMSSDKVNLGTIKVSSNDKDSKIGGYYYKFVSLDSQTASINGASFKAGSGNDTITVSPENNNKRCFIWAKDNAGNVSDAKSIDIKTVFYPVTAVKLNSTIIKKGDTATLATTVEGGNSYKDMVFGSSNSSVVTTAQNGTNVKVTGVKEDDATVTCTVTNYNNSKITGNANVKVVSAEFSPNNGTYRISSTKANDKVTLRSTVNVKGKPSKTEYAWSNSGTQAPSKWTSFESGKEVTGTATKVGNYYLWVRLSDTNDNSVTYVSKNFNVKYKVPDASRIKVNYSAKYWTNQDVIVRVESNIADFGIQISTDGKNWYPNTTYVFTTNGTIYARFYEKTTQENGNIMAINVNNIDKTPIQITNQITCTGNSSNSISVRLTTIDNESGFCKVVWHYTVISTGEHNTTEDVECNMNGYETGNRENVIKEKILTNLIQGNLYEIYAEIYDVAGNMVCTNAIEQLAGKHYGNIKVTENNTTTCIGKNLTFSVTSNKSGGKLSVSSDNTSIADASISENKITVQPKGVGKANIVVTSAETPNYYMTNTSISVEFFNHIPTEGGNKKSDATCTSPAVYYKKCSECGKQLTSTYTSGNALGHDYKTEKIIGDWKFTENNGSGGTGKVAAVFNRAGQYARFTYSASNPHTMKVLYCTSDTSSSIDLCLGTTTSATSAIVAFRAWGSGYKILYNNGKHVNDSNDTTEVGANGMYNSYIDWGHNSKGKWTFTIFSNSDHTAAHPETCVRKYCSRCSHSEDYYREY